MMMTCGRGNQRRASGTPFGYLSELAATKLLIFSIVFADVDTFVTIGAALAVGSEATEGAAAANAERS